MPRTRFLAKRDCHNLTSRDSWILATRSSLRSAPVFGRHCSAVSASSAGAVIIDQGAADALKRHKTLLAVGVRGIRGEFDAGSIIEIIDESRHEIGCGMVQISSRDLRDRLMRHARKDVDVIHARRLGTERVIRAMPNMPARIGKGMTVWMAGKGITAPERNTACAIFRAFGQELEVSDEKLIDAATAISGSGPAYVFLFAEALEDTASQFGFSPEQRRLLVRETLRGASELYARTDESPTSLRGRVTSRGGTTEAALKPFISMSLQNCGGARSRKHTIGQKS